MSTLLVKNAALLVTMDEERRRIEDGGIFVRDNVIEAVGPTAVASADASELPQEADRVIDASGVTVLPGLVNTHHHLYQTLTRALPAVQDVELFDWLRTLYPIWAELTGEAVYVSALVGLAELILSGCTTTTDHLYLFPNDALLDDEIRAARELGIRFHPCRGSMSLGQSQGGLPPDRVVQSAEAILADCQRVIEEHHDPKPYSMCRIVLAPCSPQPWLGSMACTSTPTWPRPWTRRTFVWRNSAAAQWSTWRSWGGWVPTSPTPTPYTSTKKR